MGSGSNRIIASANYQAAAWHDGAGSYNPQHVVTIEQFWYWTVEYNSAVNDPAPL